MFALPRCSTACFAFRTVRAVLTDLVEPDDSIAFNHLPQHQHQQEEGSAQAAGGGAIAEMEQQVASANAGNTATTATTASTENAAREAKKAAKAAKMREITKGRETSSILTETSIGTPRISPRKNKGMKKKKPP